MKQITAWILLLVMIMISGCGKKDEESIPNSGNVIQNNGTAEPNSEGSMGRYLERQIDLPDDVQAGAGFSTTVLEKLEGKELAILEKNAGFFISNDMGESWESKRASWLWEILGGAYVSQIAIAPNGAAAAIYVPKEEEETEDDGRMDLQFQYLYVDASGTAQNLDYDNDQEDLIRMEFGPDDQLYGYGYRGNVFKIEPETGASERLFETKGMADYVCFTGRYMVVFASGGTFIYDMEQEILISSDTVLEDFIKENTNEEIGASTDSHLVVAAEGEQEDVIYLALETGLYRHVIGGTVMEQLADGSVNSLGDPQMHLQGMVYLGDQEFAILYQNAQLYHYYYDANIPSIPEEQIGIYSLTDNYTIRQAVSLFQKQHSEVYVRYEVGMTGEDGMTAEDAIKNLNTKLLAGNGPDILVLDGLPVSSYEQKGVLADLTALEAEFAGENTLFSNLVDAMRKDGKLYTILVRFQIPMVVGNPGDLAKITDLSSFADAVERLREENPKGRITSLMTPKWLLPILEDVSQNAWLTENGTLDEKALTEFLTEAKRIYEAEIAGYDSNELLELQSRAAQSTILGDYYKNIYSSAVDIAQGDGLLGIGVSTRMTMDFDMLSTLANQGALDYAGYQGQVPGGFVPKCSVGIYVNSMEKSWVNEFFRFLFQEQLQDMELEDGYPIRKASFENMKKGEEEESGMGLAIGGSDSDGDYFSLDIKYTDEKNFQRLKDLVAALDTACINDTIISQAVYDSGAKVLEGTLNVEDAVREIAKKVSIYLAE